MRPCRCEVFDIVFDLIHGGEAFLSAVSGEKRKTVTATFEPSEVLFNHGGNR
jgi:hypothetical protein